MAIVPVRLPPALIRIILKPVTENPSSDDKNTVSIEQLNARQLFENTTIIRVLPAEARLSCRWLNTALHLALVNGQL